MASQWSFSRYGMVQPELSRLTTSSVQLNERPLYVKIDCQRPITEAKSVHNMPVKPTCCHQLITRKKPGDKSKQNVRLLTQFQ